MKLNFDKSSLEISSTKIITSVISIVPVDNIFFPEKNWNDSVVNVLSSWLENILLISVGHNEAQFTFFDGPFSFKIMQENPKYVITLFQGSKRVGTFNIDFREFAFNLVKLSQEVVGEAVARGWKSDDLKHLELALKKTLPYFDLKSRQN